VSAPASTVDTAQVMTVTGTVPATELGHVAFHEHLLCDLRPRDPRGSNGAVLELPISLSTYYEIRRQDINLENLLLDSEDDAAAELEAFRAAGGGTVVDLTLDCIGRDPASLRRLSERTGVNIVMGCGWYVHEFHGTRPHTDTIADLAASIQADLGEGVGGVCAGVIGEIGLGWPVEPCEQRVLEAAVAAQRRTGASLVIHPGRHPRAALDAVERVRSLKGDLSRTVISHVERTLFDLEEIKQVAASGAVLSFDLFGHESSYYAHGPIEMPNDAGRQDLIRAVLDAGFGPQVVISQDICSKVHTKKWGGEGYTHILDRVIPQMVQRGFGEAEIAAITRENPARLLSIPTQSTSNGGQ
jgi:phosphotriesterase-related protein